MLGSSLYVSNKPIKKETVNRVNRCNSFDRNDTIEFICKR